MAIQFFYPYLLRLHYLYGYKSSFKTVAAQASNFPVHTYINHNATVRTTLYPNHPNILRVSQPQLISLSSLVDNYQGFFGFKPDIIAYHHKDFFKIPQLFSSSGALISPISSLTKLFLFTKALFIFTISYPFFFLYILFYRFFSKQFFCAKVWFHVILQNMYFTLLYSSLKPNTVSFAFSSYGNEPEIKSLRDSDVQTYEFLHSHLHTDHIGYNYYYQNLDSRFQRYEQNIHPNHFIGNKIYRPLFSSFYSYQSINIHTSRSSTIPLYYPEPKISALILGSPEFYSDIVKFVFC